MGWEEAGLPEVGVGAIFVLMVRGEGGGCCLS